MRFLFLVISFLYAFVFYLFHTLSLKKDIFFHDTSTSYQQILSLSLTDSFLFSDSQTLILQSFFWNLLYEMMFFLLVWVGLFFYFSPKSQKSTHHDVHQDHHSEEHSHAHESQKIDLRDYLNVFQGLWYYFWFILFYVSIFLIFSYFDFMSFWLFIVGVNILVYVFYFASGFSKLSKDFLKTNLVLFSLYYLLNYGVILFDGNNYFTWIDFLNSFLLVFIYPTILYFEKNRNHHERLDPFLVTHFSIYIFWVTLFYSFFYILNQWLLFWFALLTTVFGMVWFEWLPKISYLKQDKFTLRYIWIVFSYIGMVCWFLSLFLDFHYFIFLVLVLQSYYNFFIHKKYVNIVSFFLSVFGILFLLYFFILRFDIFDYKGLYFFLLSLNISFLLVVLTYIFPQKTVYDTYILHGFSYVLNGGTLILFFLFIPFDILNIWILLFIESLYFFVSYNKLKGI